MTRIFQTGKPLLLAIAILFGILAECQKAMASDTEVATVAGGCFWCVESDFEGVPGVLDVVSGFTGGTVADPSYREVVRGGTGHVEAVQITYNPAEISYREILDLFFRSVDPTDDGGQFCDRGPTYATAILVSDAAQKQAAEAAKSSAQAELGQTIVTPLREASTFFPAEAKHQDYYKGSNIVLTRFGPRKQSVAYKLYREGGGRDARVRELWGNEAPFVSG